MKIRIIQRVRIERGQVVHPNPVSPSKRLVSHISEHPAVTGSGEPATHTVHAHSIPK